jgi:ATP-dependent helicase HrpA
VRYLKAISWRLDKLPTAVRDAERTVAVRRITDEYREVLAALPESARSAGDAGDVRWMIEELRVSLFAQTLGTPAPVSEKRILTALGRLTAR